MPALPSLPNTLRLIFPFVWADGGPIGHVRQFWKYTGTPPSASDAVALANDAMTLAATYLAGGPIPAIQFAAARVTDMASPTGADQVSTHSNISGTNGGAALPQDTCTMAYYLNPRRYRGGHPREYWPFGSEANLADELHWDSSWVTAMFTDISNFLNGFEGSSSGGTTVGARVMVSYYEGFTVHMGTTGRARNVATPRSSPLIDEIDFQGVKPFIAVQRRRRGKV